MLLHVVNARLCFFILTLSKINLTSYKLIRVTKARIIEMHPKISYQSCHFPIRICSIFSHLKHILKLDI